MSSHRASAGADKPAMAPLLLCPYFLPSVPFSRGWGQSAISRTPQRNGGTLCPSGRQRLGANRHLGPLGAESRASPQAAAGRYGLLLFVPAGAAGGERALSQQHRLPCRAGPCLAAGTGGDSQGRGQDARRPARRGAGPAAAGRGGRRSQPSCVRCRGWGGCWRRGGGGGRRAAASAPWPATARSSGGGPTLPITASTLVSSSPRGPVTSPTLPSPPRDGARRGEAAAACRSY